MSLLENKAAVYVRVAHAEPGSLEPQEAAVRRYVESLGLEVYGVYQDEGVSANVPMEERPGGKKLMEDARAGRFSHVVVYDLARIGRDVQTMARVIADLDAVKVMLHSVQKAEHLAAGPLKVLLGGELERLQQEQEKKALRQRARRRKAEGPG